MQHPFEFVDENKLLQGLNRHQPIFLMLTQLGISKEWITKLARWNDELISAVLCNGLIQAYQGKTRITQEVKSICDQYQNRWDDPTAKAVTDAYYEGLQAELDALDKQIPAHKGVL
jgi:hypothetical protein